MHLLGEASYFFLNSSASQTGPRSWKMTNNNFSLFLLKIAKCFVPVQIFWVSPKIWLHLVPLQNLLCRHKKQFCWMLIIFLSYTKCLWLAQYVNNFFIRQKKLGPAQNILQPAKDQGISQLKFWSEKQTVDTYLNFKRVRNCAYMAWHDIVP